MSKAVAGVCRELREGWDKALEVTGGDRATLLAYTNDVAFLKYHGGWFLIFTHDDQPDGLHRVEMLRAGVMDAAKIADLQAVVTGLGFADTVHPQIDVSEPGSQYLFYRVCRIDGQEVDEAAASDIRDVYKQALAVLFRRVVGVPGSLADYPAQGLRVLPGGKK